MMMFFNKIKKNQCDYSVVIGLMFFCLHFNGFSYEVKNPDPGLIRPHQFQCDLKLKEYWVNYDQSSDLFVPFVKKTPSSFFSVFFEIEQQYFKKQLFITSPARLSIFIDEKLVDIVEPKESKIIKLDQYIDDSKQRIIVNLFSSDLTDQLPDTCIGSSIETVELKKSKTSTEALSFIREIGNYKIFGIFGAFFIVIMLLVYRGIYHSISNYYFNIREAIGQVSSSENSIYSRIHDISHHFLLFNMSLMIAYLYVIIEKEQAIENVDFIFQQNFSKVSIWIFVYQWLTYSFYVYFFILLKMIGVKMMSVILGIDKLYRMYVFEFFRLGIHIYLTAFIVCFCLFFSTYEPYKIDFYFLYYLLFGLTFMRLLILAYKFYYVMEKRKLLLFSYVFMIDILPFFVGMKVFLLS